MARVSIKGGGGGGGGGECIRALVIGLQRCATAVYYIVPWYCRGLSEGIRIGGGSLPTCCSPEAEGRGTLRRLERVNQLPYVHPRHGCVLAYFMSYMSTNRCAATGKI